MERIDDAVPDLRSTNETEHALFKGQDPLKKIQFWENFVKEDMDDLDRIDAGTAGAVSFQSIIEDHHENNELWVAYASLVKINDIDMVQPEDIEMYMSVSTTKGAPMYANMGIQRPGRYMGRERRKHGRLSIPIHSFTAKVMIKAYGSGSRVGSKQYMISAPVSNMQRLIRENEALRDNTYWGDNRSRAKDVLDGIKQEDYNRMLGPKYVQISTEARVYRRIVPKISKLLRDNFYENYLQPIFEENGIMYSDDFLIDLLQDTGKQLQREIRKARTERLETTKEMETMIIDRRTDVIPSLEDSPIILKQQQFILYDKTRSQIIFVYDEKTNQVATLEEEGGMLGTFRNAGTSYDWFFYAGHLGPSWGYMTMDVDALANADRFECVTTHDDGTLTIHEAIEPSPLNHATLYF
ncbi:MAG: hypothetical protein ACTSUE_02045 [Promethearchaeota archaeon]